MIFGRMRIPQLRNPLVDVLRTLARELHALKEMTVANFEALNQRLDTLTASLESAKARIAEDFQALKDLLANGDTADQAAVDAAVARLDESIAGLDAVDPDPSNPAPAEPEQPSEG